MSLYKKYENGVNSYGGNMSEEEINSRFNVTEGNGYGSIEEYYFKTFGPLTITYYEDALVWRILRIK